MSGGTTTPLTRLGAKLATRSGIRLLVGLVLLAVAMLMQNGIVTIGRAVFRASYVSFRDGAGAPTHDTSYERMDVRLEFDFDDLGAPAREALVRSEALVPMRRIDKAATTLRAVLRAIALISLVSLVEPGRMRIWAWCVIATPAPLLAAGAYFWLAVGTYPRIWLAFAPNDWDVFDPNNTPTLSPCVTAVSAAVLCLVAAAGAVLVLRHLRAFARGDAELRAF